MHARALARLRTVRTRSFATAATHPPLVGLSSTARAQAEKISAEWGGTSATGGNTKNLIGGEFVESTAADWIDVVDPVRGTLQVVFKRSDPASYTGNTNTPDACARDYKRRVCTSR